MGKTKTGTATVDASDLLRAAKFAGQVVERRNTIPVIGTVLVEFEPGYMRITGSDLDTWCSIRVPAECNMKFRFCVSPRAILDIAHIAFGGAVTITHDVGSHGVMKCSFAADSLSVTFNQIMSPEDFPEHAGSKKTFKASAEVPENILAKCLQDTIPFISREATRYYLNGIYFHANKTGSLIAVSTDGHRLARRTTDVAWSGLDGIMPAKTAAILARETRKDGNRPIRISGADSVWRIAPEDGEWVINHKLIDGTYPDYNRAISEPAQDISVPITREQIRRIMRFATDGSGGVPILTFRPESGEIACFRLSDGVAATIPLHDAKGENFDLNARYVADIARRHGTVRLTSKSKTDPFNVITEDPDFTMIVMPVRV